MALDVCGGSGVRPETPPACLLHVPSHLLIPSPLACWPGQHFFVRQIPFDPDGCVPPPPRHACSARPPVRPHVRSSAFPIVRRPSCPPTRPPVCPPRPLACLQRPAGLQAALLADAFGSGRRPRNSEICFLQRLRGRIAAESATYSRLR